jgi:transposase InsO family protein
MLCIPRTTLFRWYYLSTILDDYSRNIIDWKFCTNMRAEDVTDTIQFALAA